VDIILKVGDCFTDLGKILRIDIEKIGDYFCLTGMTTGGKPGVLAVFYKFLLHGDRGKFVDEFTSALKTRAGVYDAGMFLATALPDDLVAELESQNAPPIPAVAPDRSTTWPPDPYGEASP